jgi:hypothetical protein
VEAALIHAERREDGQVYGLAAWHHFSRKQRYFWRFVVAGRNKTYLCVMQNARIFPILNEFGLFRRFFTKVTNIKFQGNPSSGDVTYMQSGRRKDMTKVTGVLRDYAKKNLKSINITAVHSDTVNLLLLSWLLNYSNMLTIIAIHLWNLLIYSLHSELLIFVSMVNSLL